MRNDIWRRRWSVAALALLTLPGLGCLAETGTEVTVNHAELSGRLGRYRDGPAVRIATHREGYVELRSSGIDGAIMAGLTVDEGLRALEPGVTYVFEDGEGGSVIGCGGPHEDSWEWDRYADRVTLTVEALGDGARRVRFEASWRNHYARLAGSFDYVR